MGTSQPRSLIFFSSKEELPSYLQKIRGTRWQLANSSEKLKQALKSQKGEAFLVVHASFLSKKTVQAFLAWRVPRLKISLIFIGQVIEKDVHQLLPTSSEALILFESEGERIGDLVTRRLMGRPVYNRKQERIDVHSQVMLKKSIVAEQSPTGSWVQFLGGGLMQNFSQGGAQIVLPRGEMRARDFISLMYQDCQGQWVSVESQVRWVVSSTEGKQIIGVQFLAVSA